MQHYYLHGGEIGHFFFHRKLRKKCYYIYITIRLILIISLYIIKLVLIFFLFLIYFYYCDIMACLLLFQLHKCLKYARIILKISKNKTKVPLNRRQKYKKWKPKNFQERIRPHKYEKYLKIIPQLFKKDLIYGDFNLKKKHQKCQSEIANRKRCVYYRLQRHLLSR